MQTLNRGAGLIYHPVAFHHTVGGQRETPGHVQSAAGHLGETDEAGSAGGCENRVVRSMQQIQITLKQ